MKIYHKNRFIKTIPEKYKDIQNITDYLDNEFTPRLTFSERIALDLELMKIKTNSFLKHKKFTDRLLSNQISDSQPIVALYVTTRSQGSYYALKMSNGVEIKCGAREFKQSPVKQEIKRLY